MCGFVGIWDKDGRVTEQLLTKSGTAIAHRGPDYQGTFHEKNIIGFVHQRLSIIDIDSRSNQPMQSKNQRYTLVFNGEIYNYALIRRELENEGEIFNTESDTEVLLRLFEKHGEKCLKELEGMFAFCIYDKQTKRWFIARDRMGIKPLYYYIGKNTVAITSDLKAFQKVDFIPKKIDRQAIWQYLHYGFVPQPQSIFQEVKKLLPGHYGWITEDFKIEIHRYWSIDDVAVRDGLSNDVERFDELFIKSVEKRLISDVEVGAFSSGGLDSSSIITTINQKQLKTFTIGFEHQSNKLDLERSAEFAETNNLNQFTQILPVDCLNESHEFFELLDEPFSEASILPLWYNFKQAKNQGIKVILGGDGADELLGGYNYFDQLQKHDKFTSFPPIILKSFQQASMKLLSPFHSTTRAGKFRDIFLNQALSVYMKESVPDAHQHIISQKNEGDLVTLGLSDITWLEDVFMQDLYKKRPQDIENYLKVEMQTTLVNKHLSKVDKSSMMHGVEARVPFMDYNLVEYATGLPEQYKREKAVLKQAVKTRVPQAILTDKKRGFNLPLKQWTIDHIIGKEAIDVGKLDELGVVDRNGIDDLKNKMLKGREDTSRTLWSLFVLSHWLNNNTYEIS